MRTVRPLACTSLLLLLLLPLACLIGCSSSSSPAPVLRRQRSTSIAPTSATAGAAAFTLTVTGSGFVSGSTVQWNGSSRTTTYTSATQISAAIAASDVATAGTAQVTVVNPDAQKSGAATFTIGALPPPVLSSLSTTTVMAGAPAFPLTVLGTGFVAGSTVQWNGSARTTTYVSATQISGAITATDVAAAGTAQVSVLNPDGQKSTAATFTIAAAPVAPVLTLLAPTTATVGSAALNVTVNGTGFVSGAMVEWVGSPRATTFVSATQLMATLTAADLANTGTFSVDVIQAGLRSANQLPFGVTPVVPTIASLSPSTIAAGSAAFTLTVNGTGFTSAASVTFNGSAKTTTFVSATQLTAAITAADVATAGIAVVDVVQNGTHAASTQAFTTTVAAPVISSLSPASVVAGSADTTLSVNGTGFFSDSVIKYNGTALATTYKSSTLLQATIPAASLASATTAPITVVNPASEGGTSNPSTFTVSAAVTGKILQLISVNYATGAPSNNTFNNIAPNISQDGRYVGFSSLASNLVPNDTSGQIDAFLRDTCMGSAPAGCAPSTTRLSVDSDHVNFANGSNRMVVLSTDARYALFDGVQQDRTDLRDNCIGATGCTPSTSHPDILPGATTTVKPLTCCSVISPDGRYVLFATNDPVSGGLPRGIYVRDTCLGATGCTPATTHVVLGPGSTVPRQPFQADISTGGRYVLFRTAGSDIIPTYSGNVHLFVEDTCIGAAGGCTTTYMPIDVKADGTEGEGNMANDAAADEQPSFSKDGRYVVFSSTEPNMIAGTTYPGHVSRVYVRDTCIGAAAGCVAKTTLVSFDPAALTGGLRSFIGFRSVSEHGRYVAYVQEVVDTVIHNTVFAIRVSDTCIGAPAGCVPSISTASADPNSIGAADTSYQYPSLSADGHYAVFTGTNAQTYLGLTGILTRQGLVEIIGLKSPKSGFSRRGRTRNVMSCGFSRRGSESR